jgi:hypothetical protein
MTTINHWGKWINSEEPVTGVLSIHSIEWDGVGDEICLTCEEIEAEIIAQYEDEEERDEELESVECDSSHTKIWGKWKKGEEGKYEPDKTGEFAAILNETTVQVVWSRFTARGNVCSPCYPGQIDLDSTGEFLAYTLPDYLLYKED